MKRIISILIVLALIGLLFGCTSQTEIDDETNNENQDGSNEETTLDNEISNEIENTVIDENDDIDVGEMF